jgi:two-component system, chemotaxis family, protein-glutamate methylesterase/glutaminase
MQPPSASRLSSPNVVVADDSAFMRRVLSDVLARRGARILGQAKDGDEALALCRRVRPDVLTLDLAMPGMDGIGVLRALHEACLPIPVVVVSAFSPAHGARAVDALAEGAVELVAKPEPGAKPDRFFEELWQKVGAAALSRRAAVAAPRAAHPGSPRLAPAARPRLAGVRRTVVVACSTGGPRALGELVPKLPPRLGAGTLVVQHMPSGFTASLADRLDRASQLTVREAAGGEQLNPGTALIAPGGRHLRLIDGNGTRATRLSDEAEIGGLRPRADLTIRDAARLLGERLLLVVLTGMCKDGLDGARDVKRAGGRILVEHESTCTVYGMPRAIAEAGLADAVLPLHELPAAIAAEAGA